MHTYKLSVHLSLLELLGYMQGRYSSSLEQQLIWNGMFKKQGPFDLGMEYKQRNGDQNNLSNAFIGDPLERDSPPSDNAHRVCVVMHLVYNLLDNSMLPDISVAI